VCIVHGLDGVLRSPHHYDEARRLLEGSTLPFLLRHPLRLVERSLGDLLAHAEERTISPFSSYRRSFSRRRHAISEFLKAVPASLLEYQCGAIVEGPTPRLGVRTT
jgi:hypothetical protein